MLEHCSNTIELTLPTIKPDPEQQGKIWYVCKHWDSHIKQLLDIVGPNVKEVIVRVETNINDSHLRLDEDDLWVNNWITNGSGIKTVNIVSQLLCSLYIQG